MRRTGTLQQHPHVGTDIGWTIVPDREPDNPFTSPSAFAATNDLKQAGIIPAAGARVRYGLRHFGLNRSARAISVTKEKK
jgi:hypothetical protein